MNTFQILFKIATSLINLTIYQNAQNTFALWNYIKIMMFTIKVREIKIVVCIDKYPMSHDPRSKLDQGEVNIPLTGIFNQEYVVSSVHYKMALDLSFMWC